MSTKIIYILIIVIVVLLGVYILLPKQAANQELNLNDVFDLNNNVDVEIRDMANVPKEYYSGDSRFSFGVCQQDSECEVVGCSHETCSSDSDMVTSCEVLDNAPDKEKHACGCIKDKCGWYLK